MHSLSLVAALLALLLSFALGNDWDLDLIISFFLFNGLNHCVST